MNNESLMQSKRATELEALRELRDIVPNTISYSEIDFEQLLRIMKEPVRSISTCFSKEQLKTYCIQLLTQNLTLQVEVTGLQKELSDAKAEIDDLWETR